MEDSIFTKIIKGEIPCHKVYEDDKVLAFLDIHPIQPGHVLVVPKAQVDHFDELEQDDYQSVFTAVKRVAQRLKDVTGAKRACVRVEGFDVPHAHVHVYPCNNPQEFYGSPDRAQAEPDHTALAEMAQKLAF
jgi:histidine triad (HIT) family protein